MHTTSENSHLTLRSLLGQYPIQTCIFRNLDMKSILNLCQTSRHMRTDIRAYLWDIDEKLERFFVNPRAFRTELGRADALIAGSFALQFFANKFWPESDLDISLREGGNVNRFGQYLVEAEGYELATTHEINTFDYHEPLTGERIRGSQPLLISRVLTYIKPRDGGDSSLSTGEKCKVQLIATYGQPVRAILNRYYTSCIVNFISWNKAYCIFPRATLLFHETVSLMEPVDRNVELHNKYSRRGWRLRTSPAFFRRDHPEPQRKKRRLQDRLFPLGRVGLGDRRVGGADTWTMTLSTAGVTRPTQPDSVLEYSSFQVYSTGEQSQDGSGARIWSSVFRSHSLRYEYTYGNLEPFWSRAGDMLERNTIGQIKAKIKAAEASDLLGDGMTLFGLEFKKPDGWDYWDDILPDFFEGLKEELEETSGKQAAS
ncbi:hypothetical protein HD806DRAFT_474993 [Xylariaceae sp. AK1471]|nr:hypothetical protein HD806DRAFT_474993 [Xylariaceae sp. AK1471]